MLLELYDGLCLWFNKMFDQVSTKHRKMSDIKIYQYATEKALILTVWAIDF